MRVKLGSIFIDLKITLILILVLVLPDVFSKMAETCRQCEVDTGESLLL